MHTHFLFDYSTEHVRNTKTSFSVLFTFSLQSLYKLLRIKGSGASRTDLGPPAGSHTQLPYLLAANPRPCRTKGSSPPASRVAAGVYRPPRSTFQRNLLNRFDSGDTQIRLRFLAGTGLAPEVLLPEPTATAKTSLYCLRGDRGTPVRPVGVGTRPARGAAPRVRRAGDPMCGPSPRPSRSGAWASRRGGGRDSRNSVPGRTAGCPSRTQELRDTKNRPLDRSVRLRVGAYE